jgi:hypothetical protein
MLSCCDHRGLIAVASTTIRATKAPLSSFSQRETIIVCFETLYADNRERLYTLSPSIFSFATDDIITTWTNMDAVVRRSSRSRAMCHVPCGTKWNPECTRSSATRRRGRRSTHLSTSKSEEEKDERGHRHSIASTSLRYIIRPLDRHEAVESTWYGPLGGRSDDCVVTSPSVCFQILAPFTHCQSAATRRFSDFRFQATTHSHDLTQWVLGFWKDYNA